MKRAVPILLLTVAGLVPLWRFEAEPETIAAPAQAPTAEPAQPPAQEPGQPPAQQPSAQQPAPGSAAQTVTGPLIRTSYGDLQVQVAFEGDRITAVTMVKQPNSAPTKRAVPLLVAETLQAQSADVDTVSGATTTSEAYVESLQAAIDAKD